MHIEEVNRQLARHLGLLRYEEVYAATFHQFSDWQPFHDKFEELYYRVCLEVVKAYPSLPERARKQPLAPASLLVKELSKQFQSLRKDRSLGPATIDEFIASVRAGGMNLRQKIALDAAISRAREVLDTESFQMLYSHLIEEIPLCQLPQHLEKNLPPSEIEKAWLMIKLRVRSLFAPSCSADKETYLSTQWG